MKKYFGVFVGGFLCATASSFSLKAMENHICDPDHIFEMRKGGKATFSSRTTHAELLAHEGIEGQGLLAAVIDIGFYPQYTDLLKRKNLIHPAAFSEHLLLDPDEDLEHVNVDHLGMQVNALEKLKYSDKNKEKIEKLNDLIKRKNKYDRFLKNNKSHGSAVMEAIHQIAPKAQFLPIDVLGITKDMDGISLSHKIAYAIRKAIRYQSDVINISGDLYDTPEILKACEEAARQGIPIITSAGNDSQKAYNYQVDVKWDSKKGEVIRNPKQDLFNKLNGKNIRFIGALKYSKKGEEKVAWYTQHPSNNTDKHFLFTVGSYIPLHYRTNSEDLRWGTSFSTPTVSGGYLLLKQCAYANGYWTSPDPLLDIMYESGRKVHYKRPYDGQHVIYKSMDLWNAKQTIEEKAKAALKPTVTRTRALPPTPAPQVIPVIRRLPPLPVH